MKILIYLVKSRVFFYKDNELLCALKNNTYEGIAD